MPNFTSCAANPKTLPPIGVIAHRCEIAYSFDLRSLFGQRLCVYGITDTRNPPGNVLLCEICGIQRGIGVRRFQGCDEWKSQTSIDLHEVADGLEMHSLRLKAVELYGDSRPLETHQDLDA